MNRPNNVPDGYKLNPLLIEKKTKRVNLLLKPSTYIKGKAKAEELGVSFNELINRLIDNASAE